MTVVLGSATVALRVDKAINRFYAEKFSLAIYNLQFSQQVLNLPQFINVEMYNHMFWRQQVC